MSASPSIPMPGTIKYLRKTEISSRDCTKQTDENNFLTGSAYRKRNIRLKIRFICSAKAIIIQSGRVSR